MTQPADVSEAIRERLFPFPRAHLLSAGDLQRPDLEALLDLADAFIDLNRRGSKKLDLLKGRTLINLFFENSTRTQSSFELAGKRLGADVVNMSPRSSSISKGETLIDTAVTLWDERLSTSAVERFLIEDLDLNRKRRAQVVDRTAAAWILQGALDRLGYTG